MTKVSKSAILKAIDGTGGIVEPIVQRLKISRQAYWKWEQKYPDLIEAREEERKKQVDRGELKLFQAIDRGEKWAVLKILSTLGRERGYVEKQEIEHSGQVSNIHINLIEKSEEELKRLKNG